MASNLGLLLRTEKTLLVVAVWFARSLVLVAFDGLL